MRPYFVRISVEPARTMATCRRVSLPLEEVDLVRTTFVGRRGTRAKEREKVVMHRDGTVDRFPINQLTNVHRSFLSGRGDDEGKRTQVDEKRADSS